LIVIGLVMLVAGSGFAYWRDTRFPARTEWLAGTPVKLRIQDGVQPRELRAIRDGLRLTNRFMKRNLGRTVHGAVEARVAHANGCHPFESSSEASIGEAGHGFLCVETKNLAWQWLVQKNLVAATAISGHEYVHVLQSEIGCLPKDAGKRYRWVVEGMAEEVSWRALVAAGRATEARVNRTIRRDGAFDRGLEPLAAYEHADGRDREYALWHLAVRYLLREAVAAGAAPRDRPEVALRRFCETVANGHDWGVAFGRSFGLSLHRFYSSFRAFRRHAPGGDA
jgi:hypothetical protein